MKYINPQIIKYQNIDDLLKNQENKYKNHILFDESGREDLSIDDLLEKDFVCIVGEPGIGKSRLVAEIVNHLSDKEKIYRCEANKLKEGDCVSDSIEYYIIDALDEVDGSMFYSTLQLINQYKKNNPRVKVLFTCRKHYVASYASHFTSCEDLIYVELCRLRYKDVDKVIANCSNSTRTNVDKSTKLKELLTKPRILGLLLDCEKEKSGCSNIGELFEWFIEHLIQEAVKERKSVSDKNSLKILIQRVLEKVAFIMEISRKDQISKDELYTILDGVRGNMSQMLIANFDLLFFESRILKETNDTLQFEDTELQEYLAAKELCRLDNIESVLYDVAVQKDLKHIYPNWYDVIPHISYTNDRIDTFFNVVKLFLSYESNLENESFESLLRYVDPSICSPQQKDELFSILFTHYMSVPVYIGWDSHISKLMQEFYTSTCNKYLTQPYDKYNKIQLANITEILNTIVEKVNLDKDVSKYWTEIANNLFQDDKEEKKLVALYLYNALEDQGNLIRYSEKYNSFSQKVKERYCEVTGYRLFTDKKVVDCWLDGCSKSIPDAINAVLCIKDPLTMIYAYEKIINDKNLERFFNPQNNGIVLYDSLMERQFKIAWNNNQKSKVLITNIIANYLVSSSYSYYAKDKINPIVKKILLEKKTGPEFIKYFLNHEWSLEDILRGFDPSLVDIQLIKTIDDLLGKNKFFNKDDILIALVDKIRDDKDKKTSALEKYIKLYEKSIYRLDKNRTQGDMLQYNPLSEDYHLLTDKDVSNEDKYKIVFKLSKNIEFLNQQNSQPLVDVINTFFNDLDLDKMMVKRGGEDSSRLSLSYVRIPYYVKAMYRLGNKDFLRNHKITLAKTLPIVYHTVNSDDKIKHIYKDIIGGINNGEKKELIRWWQSRNDDFMYISPDSIFDCITDYGLNELSFKLETYVMDYIAHQEDRSHKIFASRALELISKGYYTWNIDNYKNVFDKVDDNSIDSIKMRCNAIMIEKYNDNEAIEWRIEYIKNHVVKSICNETDYLRTISIEEAEMIGPNSRMFRCFMNIRGNEKLNELMYNLFDYGLYLCKDSDTQEYSSYLLKHIYLFFVNTSNDINSILKLRKRIEEFNSQNVVCNLAYNIMINNEMEYLQKEKIKIGEALKLYNKCYDTSYLKIRNDGDLRRYFTHIQSEVQKEIQDQGIYSLVRQETLNEDFIQRELKNTIINKCCQMGLETVCVDREVALQDNKRTDLLIRYGFCNPIMVELKLLHNIEITNNKKRNKYKEKFREYTSATKSCLSVFWVFNVHKEGSSSENFEKLKNEYNDLKDTRVILTDCKCSSGVDTGIPKKKKTSKTKDTGKS